MKGEIIKLKTWTTYHKHMPPNLNAISRVIVNYQNQARKNLEGVPSDYITSTPETESEQNQGRLPILEEALRELFFQTDKEGKSDGTA